MGAKFVSQLYGEDLSQQFEYIITDISDQCERDPSLQEAQE